MTRDKDNRTVGDSRRISLILRHRPKDFHVTLDGYGWATIEELSRGSGLTSERILEIAEENPRYELSEDRTMIRASHGHSVPVSYDQVVEPPDILYHGTSLKNLEQIIESGAILPMGRVKVHLSQGMAKALDVGRRRGEPIVLVIDAHRMYRDGVTFHLSKDGVYLVDSVPIRYFIGTIPECRFVPSHSKDTNAPPRAVNITCLHPRYDTNGRRESHPGGAGEVRRPR